jgi:hypothetical protein
MLRAAGRDAENSTGIQKHARSASEAQIEWPAEVQAAIDENMADYEWLRERRVRYEDITKAQ